MPRFNAFSRNVNTIIWKYFPHKVEYTILRENSTKILEKDILRDKDGIYTVHHFVDSNNLRVEISSQKKRQKKNGA